MIDVSTGQTVPHQQPVYGRMWQTPFADKIRNEIGIATMAVGNIFECDHVNSIIAAGRADLCAIARPHLANPAWTLEAAASQGYRSQWWPPPVPVRQESARAQHPARDTGGVEDLSAGPASPSGASEPVGSERCVRLSRVGIAYQRQANATCRATCCCHRCQPRNRRCYRRGFGCRRRARLPVGTRRRQFAASRGRIGRGRARPAIHNRCYGLRVC